MDIYRGSRRARDLFREAHKLRRLGHRAESVAKANEAELQLEEVTAEIERRHEAIGRVLVLLDVEAVRPPGTE